MDMLILQHASLFSLIDTTSCHFLRCKKSQSRDHDPHSWASRNVGVHKHRLPVDCQPTPLQKLRSRQPLSADPIFVKSLVHMTMQQFTFARG